MTSCLYSLRILHYLSEILHTVLITSVNVKRARLYYCPKFLHNPLLPFNLKINELIWLKKNQIIKCKALAFEHPFFSRIHKVIKQLSSDLHQHNSLLTVSSFVQVHCLLSWSEVTNILSQVLLCPAPPPIPLKLCKYFQTHARLSSI